MKLKKIGAGALFSAALDEDGHVTAWGQNKYGQLGTEKPIPNPTSIIQTGPKPHLTPIRVNNLPLCVDMACGDYHMITLTEDNDVYEWGNKVHWGATLIKGDHDHFLSSQRGFKLVSVHCGRKYSAVVDDAGFLFTWGFARNGVMGHFNENRTKNPSPVFLFTFGDKARGTYVTKAFPGPHHLAVLTIQEQIN